MSARSEFGVVVRIEQDSITAPAGSLHRSHNPANANRESSCIPKWNGCFSFPLRRHSKNPSAGSKHRRLVKASRKAGLFATVEQRDDSQLRGKPVIVAWQGNRSVVCAASYEARSFGVHSAMPAIRAERLCPAAIFVPPDFTRYRAVSQSVREIFKRHTDLIEPLSLDEAYLDVTENKTGLATATLVARTIREQIRQELNLTASAGVAP